MTRAPRDVSGRKLISRLARLDYAVVRQVGSHIRIAADRDGVMRLTVPDDNPIIVGTLDSILGRIARHHGMKKGELIKFLEL
jgi:predicted RNA binding protein YcfA (HicA-like mRNA interferase family)